jgi:hypothetical protein
MSPDKHCGVVVADVGLFITCYVESRLYCCKQFIPYPSVSVFNPTVKVALETNMKSVEQGRRQWLCSLVSALRDLFRFFLSRRASHFIACLNSFGGGGHRTYQRHLHHHVTVSQTFSFPSLRDSSFLSHHYLEIIIISSLMHVHILPTSNHQAQAHFGSILPSSTSKNPKPSQVNLSGYRRLWKNSQCVK